MPDYRRNRVPGGTYFFTVNLFNRRTDLLVTQIPLLRAAIKHAQKHNPSTSMPLWCCPTTCTVSGPCRRMITISLAVGKS